jgi:hypothetical protein
MGVGLSEIAKLDAVGAGRPSVAGVSLKGMADRVKQRVGGVSGNEQPAPGLPSNIAPLAAKSIDAQKRLGDVENGVDPVDLTSPGLQRLGDEERVRNAIEVRAFGC